jgi:acetyl esterase/lipase
VSRQRVLGTRRTQTGPPPQAEDFENAVRFGFFVDYLARLWPPPAGACPMETVVYGTAGAGGRELTAQVYRRADASERRPGIVFVHGGGWSGGTPDFHLRHVRELAARGWVSATITYRLTPEAPWPACIEDVKCAVRWMRANADHLGVDPDRIVVAGGSAGGHLAAMAALTPGLLEGAGGHAVHSSAVAAAVLWFPPADLRACARADPFGRVAALLPDASDEDLLLASPIGHVSAAAPPILTFSGDLDVVTPLAPIEELHDELDAAGVTNELVVFEQRAHAFDFHPADWAVCFDHMCRFLDTHVAPALELTT